MSARIGLRRRHKRHKRKAARRRSLWARPPRHVVIPDRLQDSMYAVFVGGPLDGQCRIVDGDHHQVRVMPAWSIQALPPDPTIVTYVRTVPFMRVLGGRRVWVMQPAGSHPISKVFRDLPVALQERIQRALA